MAQERERELQRTAAYADGMHFTFSDCESHRNWCVSSRLRGNRMNPDEVQFTEIVFVHSSKEADQFGEHVLVVWPQENYQHNGRTRGTQYVVYRHNEGIRRRFPDIDFRDYGLPENKITVADAVDNWEVVREIWRKYRL